MTQLVKLDWPFGGFVQNSALSSQAPGTTTDCLNVRTYDQFDRRRRGGQRTGISKYLTDQIDGTNKIQGIAEAVEAFDPSAVVADTLAFSADFGNFTSTGRLATIDSTNWSDANGSIGNGMIATTPATAGIQYQVDDEDGGRVARTDSQISTGHSAIVEGTTLSTVFVARLTGKVRINTGSGSNVENLRFFWRGASGTDDFFEVVVMGKDAAGTKDVVLRKVDAGVGTTVISTAAGVAISGTGTYSDEFVLEVRVNDDAVAVVLDDVVLFSTAIGSDFNTQTEFGFGGSNHATSLYGSLLRKFEIFNGIAPVSLRTTNLVIVSNGTVKTVTPGNPPITPTNGSGAFTITKNRMDMVSAFQKVYFASGLASDYKVLDLAGDSVSTWTPSAGSLPVGSTDATKACRIIELYRGRVVMSGLQEEPQNWFMSASGNPLDWDYSPATTTAIQAVAGNNSNVGELGDVITALAPFQDDVMVMGGANTLWIMQGDPAAGGAIDNLSRNVGIVGPEAWTWDANGNLYFVALNGFYRLAKGSADPENLSQGKLDKVFKDLNNAANSVRLVYDIRWQGVHIFISPLDEPTAASTHYWWDQRENAFWPDKYPTTIGPSAAISYNADNPTFSAVIMGGYDGYVRQFDDDAKDDDGTLISSFMRFSPIVPGDVFASSRLDDFYFLTDQQSDPMTVKMFVGDSVEEAERLADAGTVRFKRTIKGGRNSTIRDRVAGNAFILEIAQTGNALLAASWAYEAGGASTRLLDRMRGRGVS